MRSATYFVILQTILFYMVEVKIVMAEHFRMDGGATFGVVPKSLWEKSWPAGDDNLVDYVCRSLLVLDGDRRILIDTGIGDKQSQKFLEHQHLSGNDTLEKSLAIHGFSTEDITDVLFTHLHYDHCGGAVRRNENHDGFVHVFPHAEYWCSQRQWDWAMNPNVREAGAFFSENLLPLEECGRLHKIGEETRFSEHIRLLQVHGHTDGQLIPVIDSNGRTLVFMADFIPSAGHIPLPWVPAYDTRPLLTMKEKEVFLDEAVQGNYILFFEHPAHHEAATLKRTEKGVRVDRIAPLAELLS